MYRIGEFSKLGKVTIKALRYYEKEKLLIPSFVDKETGYRFYETEQLILLNKIISLRQIGLSIDNIKQILNGADLKQVLSYRKEELETELITLEDQLSRIAYLLRKEEGESRMYEVTMKELPSYFVYYKEGVIPDYSHITEFVLTSGKECLEANPGLQCIEPDYCYMNYLDGEYKEKDIHIRYVQAVEKMGKETKDIHFMKLEPIQAVCIYHQGAYENLGEAYGYIMKWIEENGYEITQSPRERYIDGIWNKENVEDWLTEIQVPVRKNR
ncbi:MAG: MerR family transcriptional regulator [Clostridia bacterium]